MVDEVLKLKEIIEKNYELTILNIIKIKNVYKIISVEGDFCLKQVKQDFKRFQHILEIFNHLKNKDFNNMLDIIKTSNMEQYIKFDETYCYLTKWIECRDLNYSNIYDLIHGAQNIGNFHNYSKGFNPSESTSVDFRWYKWIKIFDKKIRDMMKFREIINRKSYVSIFDNIYLDKIDENIKLSNEAIDILNKFDYVRVMGNHIRNKSICHHDLAHHNILMNSNEIIYFIDFDYAILDTHLHDIGSFIMRALKNGNWTYEKFNLIVRSYRDVKNLNSKELNLIMGFLIFPNDFWQVGLQYYVENIDWSEDQFLKRLTRFENDKKDRCDFIRRIILKNS